MTFIEKLKALRNKTQFSIATCKKALLENNENLEKAEEALRLIAGNKTFSGSTPEGAIFTYTHHGGKIGVIVEIHCETDFGANSEEFKNFGNLVAMQIAAMAPTYVSREQISDDTIEKFKEETKEALSGLLASRSEQEANDIIDRRIKNFLREHILLEQSSIQEDSYTIKNLLDDLRYKMQENVIIKQFQRWEI